LFLGEENPVWKVTTLGSPILLYSSGLEGRPFLFQPPEWRQPKGVQVLLLTNHSSATRRIVMNALWYVRNCGYRKHCSNHSRILTANLPARISTSLTNGEPFEILKRREYEAIHEILFNM
jgi:hypothetical protein